MAETLAEPTATQFGNPLDRLLGYQLRRASSVMLADLSGRLADLQLTPTETSILLLIEANPEITQSEIGRVLGIHRANMAPLAANLVRRELIANSKVSGRARGLRLSPAGVEMVRQCWLRIETHEAQFLVGLGASERARLIELLKMVWQNRDD